MKIAIYTAVFGAYDPIKSQAKQDVETDFFYFTDQDVTHPDWQVVTQPLEHNPRKQAKFFKLMPHHVPQLEGYDYTIWLDGTFQILRPDFVRWAISHVKEHGWSMFRHNEMNCLYDEAYEMARVKKYQDVPIAEQAEFYRSQGCPETNGLYLSGFTVRDHHNSAWKKICEDWWQENINWTLRDAISLPYVLWKNKTQLDAIEGNLYECPYFTLDSAHRKHEYDPIEIFVENKL